ncbi:MAG: UvrD-helicase domain-containing protein [Xanthomonadales bacterium]|jgi:ATP-dependent DNA helicase Rep|nr:UvrD-helicase domain-containing protein [Xanthomonadales bacterium]
MPSQNIQLNDRQQAAVTYTGGPLLVLAGAGSGKTRVIIEKIVYLVNGRGLPGQKIAAITFTNKAAKEMKERLARRLGAEKSSEITVSTFHSLGWKILRAHHEQLGYRKGISILDENDSQNVVRDLLPEGTAPEMVRLARSQVSRWKNRAMAAGETPVRFDSGGEEAVWQLYGKYQEHLRNLNAVDFDDLILQALRALQDENIRAQWQNTIRYLLVDEYQDTNETQYRMLRLLAGDDGRLTAVGDDDQSIYGWRGAQPENLQQLSVDYPGLHIVKLEQNYRSCGTVLRAANALIANNPHAIEKRLWSALGEGEMIRVVPCADEHEEAAMIAAEILHRKITSRGYWGDFAVLYRGNHQSRVLEQAFREQRIPYHLSGGTSFFERTEVKDLMCYLRLAVNPDDNAAFMRVVNTPRRDIGVTSRGHIAQFAGSRHCSLFEAAVSKDCRALLPARSARSLARFCDLLTETGDRGERSDPIAAVRDLVDAIHYESWVREQTDKPALLERRLENIRELLSWLERLHQEKPGQGLVDLMGHLSLLTSLDTDKEPDQEVRLMTLHGSKGLEFPHVFMAGVEEDILPHRNSLDDGGEEEERRLMYVGITRARASLTLSFARDRRRFGESVSCEPSRFLQELPEELLEWRGQDEEKDYKRTKERATVHLDRLRELFSD